MIEDIATTVFIICILWLLLAMAEDMKRVVKESNRRPPADVENEDEDYTRR